MDKIINISWSSSTKLITSISIVILIATFYYLIKNGYLKTSLLTPLVLIFVIGLSVYFAAQSPISIKLTDSKFVLNKLIGEIEIPYSEIQLIGEYNFNNKDVRIMGSGGFCGYIGMFENSTFGKYSCYVGNTHQAFYIRTKDNKYYVISCDNRDDVVGFILQQISK